MGDPSAVTIRLQSICIVLSVLLMLAGAVGMVLSFLFMASRSMEDITSGASGFVAGSVFIAAGLISLTLIATRLRG